MENIIKVTAALEVFGLEFSSASELRNEFINPYGERCKEFIKIYPTRLYTELHHKSKYRRMEPGSNVVMLVGDDSFVTNWYNMNYAGTYLYATNDEMDAIWGDILFASEDKKGLQPLNEETAKQLKEQLTQLCNGIRERCRIRDLEDVRERIPEDEELIQNETPRTSAIQKKKKEKQKDSHKAIYVNAENRTAQIFEFDLNKQSFKELLQCIQTKELNRRIGYRYYRLTFSELAQKAPNRILSYDFEFYDGTFAGVFGDFIISDYDMESGEPIGLREGDILTILDELKAKHGKTIIR